MKTYKTAKGWAIFIYITAPILILVFLGGLGLPFFDDEIPIEFLYFMGPLSVGMIGFMTIILLDTIYGKLIISKDTISLKSTLGNRDLKFSEVKGFTIIETHYIFIHPNTPNKKRLKISTYIEKKDELLSWLAENFTDLALENAKQEQEEILANKTFGIDKRERTARLKQAKTVTTILDWISVLFFCWALFYPQPYELLIIALIAIPIFALLTIARFKGLIKLDGKKGGAYPSVIMSLFLPAGGLMLRGLIDFENIYDYANIWLPTLSIAFLLITPILVMTKELSFKSSLNIGGMFGMLLIGLAYGYGAAITTNCYYDKSNPKAYTAEIVSKRIDSGQYTSHHFELTPWGNKTAPEEVVVTENLYEKSEIGDTVVVYLKDGRFNIPWFIVQ